MHEVRPKRIITGALLVLLASIGLVVRVAGLNWGMPDYSQDFLQATVAVSPHNSNRGSYHLDEGLYLAAIASMRPSQGDFDVHDYHWGTFQMYAVYGMLRLCEFLGLVPAPWQSAWVQGKPDNLARIYTLGRLVSALMGAACSLVVFALGDLLAGIWVGVGAGLIYALSPLAVAGAHYLTGDVTASTLMAAAILACLLALRRDDFRWLALGWGLLGLAVAAKYLVVFAVPALLLAQYGLWRHAREAGSPRATTGALDARGETVSRGSRIGLLLLPWGAAALGFIVGEPYALLAPARVLDTLRTAQYENRIEFGVAGFDPLQVLGSQLFYLGGFGLTWPVSVLACLGLGVVLIALLRHRSLNVPGMAGSGLQFGVLLVAIAGLTFALILDRYALLRYTQPLAPLLAAFAALGWTRIPGRWWRVASGSVALAGLGIVTLGQLSLFTGPHPANQLLNWVHSNLKPGTQIGIAYNDYPPLEEDRYKIVRMTGDPADLPVGAQPDWLVMSNMLYNPPGPLVTALLERQYHEVARFQVSPHIGGLSWDEGSSPHDWKYNHPTFVVYERR